MSAAIACRVFGAEVNVALIRLFHEQPGSTQADAVASLRVPRTVISTSLATLVEAAVVVIEVRPSGPRPGRYRTDERRVAELLEALATYAIADASHGIDLNLHG